MIELTVDGAPLTAPEGQSLAAALLNAGRGHAAPAPSGTPRGLYCGIGVCQECRVVVDGRSCAPACTPVSAGMRVATGHT